MTGTRYVVVSETRSQKLGFFRYLGTYHARVHIQVITPMISGETVVDIVTGSIRLSSASLQVRAGLCSAYVLAVIILEKGICRLVASSLCTYYSRRIPGSGFWPTFQDMVGDTIQ